MNVTRDHIERLIIDRIILDTPEGIRVFNQTGSNQKSTIQTSPIQTSPAQTNPAKINRSLLANNHNFLSLPQEELRLDERLPHSLLNPIALRIKLIAERYTNLRESTITALSEQECQAYAAYYLLINIEKIARLLATQSQLTSSSGLRVLDYGCGPGTGGLALALTCKNAFSLTAIDSNPGMRKVALKLIADLKNWGSLTSYEILPLQTEPKGLFDLIIIGHVLNEMPVPEQEQLLLKLLSRLTSTGTLLILESALPQQTRELMAHRDFLLAHDTSLKIVFPCTHQAPCPMLKNSTTDWCHGSMNWKPPHLIRQLDQLTGFNKHAIKYSGLIFNRSSTPLSLEAREYRVVGPTEHNKTGHTLSICGSDFFGATLLQKKSRRDENIELRRAEHFDLIAVEGNEPVASLFPESLIVSRVRAP